MEKKMLVMIGGGGSGKTAILEELFQGEAVSRPCFIKVTDIQKIFGSAGTRKLTDVEKILVSDHIPGATEADVYCTIMSLAELENRHGNNNNHQVTSMCSTNGPTYVNGVEEKTLKKLEKQARKAERRSKR